MGLDLSLEIGNSILKNPIGVASGTFGYATEFSEVCDINKIGAVYTKAISLNPREGNPSPRIVETKEGILNSIGLANVGVDKFITEKIPNFRNLECDIIVNVAGSSEEEYIKVVEKLTDKKEIWGFEINLSCPNVKTGCLAFGTIPENVELLTKKIKGITSKPIIIKLTPNVTDITSIALAAEKGGADAVSCINTLIGMAIDIHTGNFKLANKTGGLSGPAIKPVGIANVYKVSKIIKIPVIGIGGIMSGEDAIEYLIAGASAIQIGTGNFIYPNLANTILSDIKTYMQNKKLKNIQDFKKILNDY